MYNDQHYFRLRERLKIDQLELDREFCEHQVLLLEAIEHRARAEELRDLKKVDRDMKIALAAADLRETPLAGDKGKTRSETQIASELMSVADVVEAKELVAEAELDLNLWTGLVDAMRQKGHSLKSIADLTIAGFIAPDAAIRAHRTEMGEARENRRRARASVA